MSDFKVIETQEQLDAILGERLKRQAETLEKKYSNYLSPDDFNTKVEGLNAQINELGNSLKEEKEKSGTFESTITELNAKVKKYETDSVKTRITAELGLPFEIANRITGETEEEMLADAKVLQGLFGKSNTAPLAKGEGGADNSTEADLKKMLHDLSKC